MAPDEVDQESEEDGGGAPAEETPYEFEDRFKELLRVIGLVDVEGGRSFTIGGHQVDACGGIGDTLLVFDCTIRKGNKGTSKQVRTKIDGWRGKFATLDAGVRAHDQFGKYRQVRLVIAANAAVSETDLSYGRASEPVIQVLNRQNIEYLTEIADDIGAYAKYRLASILEITIARPATTVDAIRVDDRGKLLYTFAANAKDVAELAFVPQAEAGFKLFYQRLIKKSKIRAISSYVQTAPRPFPNSVILSTRSEPTFDPTHPPVQDSGVSVSVGRLTLPREYGSCWVVDGQHRIYGSALSSRPPVILVTLVPTSALERARYFLDINSFQTKIDSNLKWDLASALIPDQPEGKISAVCQALDEADGPLKNSIQIPHKGPTRGRPVKLSGLCDAVLRNRIHECHQYRGSSPDGSRFLTRDLNLWLVQIAQEVPEGGARSAFVFDNSGLSVLMILFKRIAKRLDHARPTLEQLQRYAQAFAGWLSQLDPQEASRLARRCASEGGRAEVADLAVSAMNETLAPDQHLEVGGNMLRLADEIVSFEGRLRSDLNVAFGAVMGPNWLSKTNLGNEGRAPKSPEDLTLGQMRTLLSQEPFWKCVKADVDRKGVKQELFLSLMDYVNAYRNAHVHGKVQDRQRLSTEHARYALRIVAGCIP